MNLYTNIKKSINKNEYMKNKLVKLDLKNIINKDSSPDKIS